jgi:hypothetical protein
MLRDSLIVDDDGTPGTKHVTTNVASRSMKRQAGRPPGSP